MAATRTQPRIDDADAARMRLEYEADEAETVEAMEKRWGWSASAIACAIQRAGGTLRGHGRRRVLVFTDAEVLQLFEVLGWPGRRIADLSGTTPNTVHSAMARARRNRPLL